MTEISQFAKRLPRATIPLFDPLLDSARAIASNVQWFRQELARAQVLCNHQMNVVVELESSGLAMQAAATLRASIEHMQQELQRASDYCSRLESLTAELQQIDLQAEAQNDPKLPRLFQTKED